MTVLAQTPNIKYEGDGVTTIYAFSFRLLQMTDLKVFVDTVQQVLYSNYTIENLTEAGGEVHFITPPADGLSVQLIRATAKDQQADYEPFTPFPANTTEFTIDKLTMITQELEQRFVDDSNPQVLSVFGRVGDVVAEFDDYAGFYMDWKKTFVSGTEYNKSTTLRGDGWTMVANKDTSEYPFPQTVTDIDWAVFGDAIPAWVAQSTSTTRLLTGIKIVPDFVAMVQGVRVWIPIIDPDVGYYVVSQVEGQVAQYRQLFPTETGWFPVTFSAESLAIGVPVEIYLVTQGQGTTSTTFTHNFTYRLSNANPNPDNPPTLGQFRHFNTNAPDIAYINKTDADGVARKGDLDTLQAGDTIAWTDSGGIDVFFTLTADPTYYNSPVGEEDFYELNISPAVGQGSNGTVAMTFTHFLDRPTSYVQITNQFLGVDSAKGLLSTTGNLADVVETDDAYGIDVLYQEVSFPSDWDVVAHSTFTSDGVRINPGTVDPGSSLPPGGDTGQLIVKQSATEGDADWHDLVLDGGNSSG